MSRGFVGSWVCTSVICLPHLLCALNVTVCMWIGCWNKMYILYIFLCTVWIPKYTFSIDRACRDEKRVIDGCSGNIYALNLKSRHSLHVLLTKLTFLRNSISLFLVILGVLPSAAVHLSQAHWVTAYVQIKWLLNQSCSLFEIYLNSPCLFSYTLCFCRFCCLHFTVWICCLKTFSPTLICCFKNSMNWCLSPLSLM